MTNEITETERLPLRLFAEKAYLDYSIGVLGQHGMGGLERGDKA
jgi:hypothetical protein